MRLGTLGRSVCAATLVLLVCGGAAAMAAGDHPAKRGEQEPLGDRIVIDTAKRTLTVFAGEKELRKFQVSLGHGGLGKVKRGDGKNPLGTYRLMKGRASKFHRFLPVSYPNAADAERGFKDGLITKAERDAIFAAGKKGVMPPQNTALGGAIGVHGLGRALGFDLGELQVLHRYLNGTDGCFLLTDWEVDALETLYAPGAVLEIR